MRVPGTVLAGLGLSGIAAIFGGIAPALRRPRMNQWALMALLSSTLIALGSAVFDRRLSIWTFDNALVVWLIAMSILLATWGCAEGAIKRLWQLSFAIWVLLGVAVWLGAAHLGNRRPAFYCGLLIWFTILLLCKKWFRLPSWGIQTMNTLILLIISLPILNLLYSPAEQFNLAPKLENKPYSYEVARRDPAAFARWCRYNREEGEKLFATIFDSKGTLRLLPNREVTFCESRIRINSKGFRGNEISDDKGNAYRIVALGESTTFGMTLEKNDCPWPEILERLIQEGIKPSRPVQVINAGIPGCSLKENLARLPREILGLQPDMIISYHGFNGFSYIYEGMPPTHAEPPPPYQTRPLAILADLEYKLKIRSYRKRYDLKSNPRPGYVSSPMETEYAGLYRQLIGFARTNRIRLALATYSMAVNEQSARDLVEFYQQANLGVDWQIKANLVHSMIVRQLALENPEIFLVDTCPLLDGQHEKYYDLVHFTPAGEQEMAELFFSRLRKILEADLLK